MHDFSSKTLSSNMTTRRIRLLVEKTAKSDTWSILFLSEVRHLVEKNRPSVGLCFFRHKYQNILTGIGHYKKSEWLTRLLGKLSSLVDRYSLFPPYRRLFLQSIHTWKAWENIYKCTWKIKQRIYKYPVDREKKCHQMQHTPPLPWPSWNGSMTFGRKSFGRNDVWSNATFGRYDVSLTTTFRRLRQLVENSSNYVEI